MTRRRWLTALALGSGRLVIAGEPGAGKTGAAVQLVLAALRHRDQATDLDRPRLPVPVLVTAQDWDLASQTARDWLIRRMQQTYPMFAGTAGRPGRPRCSLPGRSW